MKYRVKRKDNGDVQLVIHDNKFIVHFKGKEELAELLKYAKIADGMQNDPKKPRGHLRVVK